MDDVININDNLSNSEFMPNVSSSVAFGCDLVNSLNPSSISKLTKIISVFGTIICIIGIVGNLFSIVVLCKKSMKKLSTYSYLLGLSICDEIGLILTILVFLDYLSPYLSNFMVCENQVKLKNYHKMLLPYIHPIVSATQALSVWITLAFTIDRYLYVCKPFYGIKHCTRQRASLIIVLLYISAALYSIPQFLERTYVIESFNGYEIVFLSYTELGRNFYFISIYHLFIYCVFVTLIPFFIIIFLNGFLIYEIIKSRKRHRKMSHATLRYNQNIDGSIDPCINVPKYSMTSRKSSNFGNNHLRNDVTFMLVGLIIIFFLCQAPSAILRIITFKNLNVIFQDLYQSSLDVSNFLVVCNSTVNCILYVMLGKKFRAEFFKTFCPKSCKSKQPTQDINMTTNNRNDI